MRPRPCARSRYIGKIKWQAARWTGCLRVISRSSVICCNVSQFLQRFSGCWIVKPPRLAPDLLAEHDARREEAVTAEEPPVELGVKRPRKAADPAALYPALAQAPRPPKRRRLPSGMLFEPVIP